MARITVSWHNLVVAVAIACLNGSPAFAQPAPLDPSGLDGASKGLTGPIRLYVPQGNVSLLIDDWDDQSRFEVRTPTAVTGVRGTGWGAS